MATYQLIEQKTLTSNQSSFQFTSIPQTYTDLAFHISARNATNNYGGYQMRLNGQTTNMAYRAFRNAGSTMYIADRTDMIDVAVFTSSSDSAGQWSNDWCYIPYYTDTNLSKIFWFDSQRPIHDTTNTSQRHSIGRWNSTTAVSSVTFTVDTDSFVAGSVFTLYGILKA